MTTNVGQMMTIKIHENDSGVVVFDSVSIVDFTHVPGFTGATTSYKIDYASTANDAYLVQITTDYLTPFATSLTITQLKALAVAAVGSAELAGTLLTISPLVAGSGYFTAPSVTLTGGGVGGSASTTITGADGHLATTTVVSGGAGYSGATLTAPPASVTAVLARTVTNGVLGLTVSNAGANGFYNAVPVITIAPPPAAVTALATAPLNDGAGGVTLGALTITEPGGFYTSAPAVTLGGGNGDAVAAATLTNGAVTAITVTGAGTGFVGAVTVSVAAPPASVAGAATAVLTAHRVTSVSGVAGSGYFTAPSVSVAAPDVAPVQATVTTTFS